MQDEAKRWKERGKQLFKENRFNLLVDCYSLAICYAPTSDRELLAQLLCNRSLAHIKNNAFTLALPDAERCVKIQPKWSKVEKNCLFIKGLLYLRVFSQAVVCILVAQIYSLCSVTKIAGIGFGVHIQFLTGVTMSAFDISITHSFVENTGDKRETMIFNNER